MKDIDLNRLADVLESDKSADAMESIMSILRSANQFMSQIELLMDKAEKMGLKPLLVRGAGQKFGIDAESPLVTDNVVVPVTEQHKLLFEELNSLSVDDLKTMFIRSNDDSKEDN